MAKDIENVYITHLSRVRSPDVREPPIPKNPLRPDELRRLSDSAELMLLALERRRLNMERERRGEASVVAGGAAAGAAVLFPKRGMVIRRWRWGKSSIECG